VALLFDVLELLGAAWIAAALLQLALWRISVRTRNAAIVDVGWAASFTLAAGVFLALGDAPLASAGPAAAMVTAWSLRLAGYLASRGVISGPEEGRYVRLRRAWGARADRRFLVFFQTQAVLTPVLSLAFVMPFATAPTGPAWLRVAGAAVWLVGWIGESVADAQLAAWRRDPARAGQVCDTGLWSLSRHPNYFFEITVWCGYAIHSLAYPAGTVALVAPAILLAAILRVTGIPATEAQALRTRGLAYARYQRRVSAFVPWFPRRG
jgi:steroid 5-alpha reductase family enzyme